MESQEKGNVMVGWFEEMEIGAPIFEAASDVLQLKIAVSASGVKILVLAEKPSAAERMLGETGFSGGQIKRMLCG